MEKQNLKYGEEKKEAKEKLLAAKEKVVYLANQLFF